MDKIILQNALNSFKGKKVFITGHTGFKGSWLSYILNKVDVAHNIVGLCLIHMLFKVDTSVGSL